MFGIDFTFLFTALNLGIIYFFVNKFLFKRLGVFMEKRSASILGDIEKGETLIAEGEALHYKYEEMIEEAFEEKKVIISEAKQKASIEYEKIISEARENAAIIIEEARVESERKHELLFKEMQKEIASLAILTASKVIQANMNGERNRDLVNDFLSKGGAA